MSYHVLSISQLYPVDFPSILQFASTSSLCIFSYAPESETYGFIPTKSQEPYPPLTTLHPRYVGSQTLADEDDHHHSDVLGHYQLASRSTKVLFSKGGCGEGKDIPFRIRQLYHRVPRKELFPNYLLGCFLGISIMLDFSNLNSFSISALTQRKPCQNSCKKESQLTSFL